MFWLRKKKTIFSYALLSGDLHETVVRYIQYATSEGSGANAHLEPSPFAYIYYFNPWPVSHDFCRLLTSSGLAYKLIFQTV